MYKTMLWLVSLISCILPSSQLFLNKVSTYFSMKIVFKILGFASKTFFFLMLLKTCLLRINTSELTVLSFSFMHFSLNLTYSDDT